MPTFAMPKIRKSSIAIAAVLAAAAAEVFVPAPAASADERSFEAGEVCDFPIAYVTKPGHLEHLDDPFHPGAAEVVSITNLDSGETYDVPSWGRRLKVTAHDDGTTSVVFNGHVVLILFAEDDGGGILPTPSATLIAGRTEFTVDTDDAYTVTKVSGKTTDICAELSS